MIGKPWRQRLDRLTGHHLPQERAVGDGARDRAHRIQRADRAANAFARQPRAARLQSDEPAERRRDAHAAEAIAADTPAGEPRGNGNRGARTRAARRISRCARVFGHRVRHQRADAIHPELRHLRLAEDLAAGGTNARDDRRVVICELAAIRQANAGAHARDVELILDHHAFATERTGERGDRNDLGNERARSAHVHLGERRRERLRTQDRHWHAREHGQRAAWPNAREDAFDLAHRGHRNRHRVDECVCNALRSKVSVASGLTSLSLGRVSRRESSTCRRFHAP